MVSKARLDNKPFMLNVSKENGHDEREIMLGLPKRYIEDASMKKSFLLSQNYFFLDFLFCTCINLFISLLF